MRSKKVWRWPANSGVDQFRVATPFDVSWDDPEMKPAAVEPVTYDLQSDPVKSLAANWNPFGAEPAPPAIEREFASSWADRLTSLPDDIDRDNSHSRHVCHWLYKNMVMDATGRIIPCCAAPQPHSDLVFAHFTADAPESFNSAKYRVARQSFIEKPVAAAVEPQPHCVNCDWFSDQQAAQIDSAQVQNYLNSVGKDLFDKASLSFLSKW